MSRRFPRFSRRWLILPPILVGVVVVALAKRNSQGPTRVELAETPRTLRVVTVHRERVAPVVIGHGLSQPARTWRAVSEVDGRVVETHPRLDPGEAIPGGAMLLKIDPTDYQLRVRQLESQAAAVAAQIRELETMRENDRMLLAIEQQALELAAQDLERNRPLIDTGAVSRAEYDSLQRALLTTQRRVQDLTNALTVAPTKIHRLEAEQEGIGVQMDEAQRDLARTTIVAPFPCQLANVHIESGQYVGPGETLFEVHGLRASEVEAQIPLEDLQLLTAEPSTAAPHAMAAEVAGDVLRGRTAIVRVRSGSWSREWSGTVVRIREQVRQTTRTAGVVVRVEHPGSLTEPSSPPILAGVFCEVELRGLTRADQLVVPRVAIREGKVYVVDNHGRLASRVVTAEWPVGDSVVVSGELKEGERVVVSDPSPAVEGMLVEPDPVEDQGRTRFALTP